MRITRNGSTIHVRRCIDEGGPVTGCGHVLEDGTPDQRTHQGLLSMEERGIDLCRRAGCFAGENRRRLDVANPEA